MYFFFEKMESCITRLIGRWFLHSVYICTWFWGFPLQPQEDVLWVGHFPPELPGTCRQQAVPVPPWTDRDLSRRHVSLHLRQLQCHPSKVRGGWFYGCWTSTMGFLITILMIVYKMFQDLLLWSLGYTVWQYHMNIDSKACKHVINNECMVQLVSIYIGVRGWGGFLCRHLKTKRHTSNEYWVCRFFISCGICCRLFSNPYWI